MTSLLGESHRTPEGEYSSNLWSQPDYLVQDSWFKKPWVISAARASKGKIRIHDQPVMEKMDGYFHVMFG